MKFEGFKHELRIWNGKDLNMNYVYMKWEGFPHELRLYEMGRISTWITFIWNGKDFKMNYVYMKWEGFQHELRWIEISPFKRESKLFN